MAEGKVKIDVDLNEKGATSGIGRLKSALNGLESAGTKAGSVFKSVLGANLVSAGITAGISGISNGIRGMVTELNSSAKAWQTFEGNMSMIGKSKEEIAQAKGVMQDYATKTIYNASEMAQTYSQLAAVGIKETDKLVTGFGGLAAAAENPKQAMKTLSQQATQMAAKPKVAWQDFKLMLEQTPAGMAAIAKEMGMSLEELVKGVQDGTVKTEDFFNAIKKVGNNADFSKMATEFKTIDQAIDGAKESLAVKLQPAFEKFNKFGIRAITGVVEALEKIDFGNFAEKLGSFLDGINIEGIVNGITTSIKNVVTVAKELWKGLNDSGAVSAVISAFNNVQKAVTNLVTALSNSGAISTFAHALGLIVNVVAKVISGFAKLIASLPPSVISAIAYSLLGIVGSLKAIKLATKGLDLIKGLNPFKLFKKNATESLDEVTKKARSSKSTLSQIFGGFGKLLESAGKGIATSAKGIGTGIKTALSGVPSVLTALGTGISTAAQGIGTGLAIAFKGLGSAIAMVPPQTWLALGGAILMVCAGLALLGTQGDGVAKVFQALGSAVSQVILALGTGLSAVLVSLGSVIQSVGTAIQSVGNGIRLVFEGIGTVIQSVGTAIKSVLEGLGSAFTGFGNGVRLALEGVGTVITSVGTAIQSALQGVASIIDSVGNAIKSALEGVGSVIESVGTAIKSVLEGVGTAFEKFGNAVKTVCDGVKEVIDSIGNSIRTVLDGVANVIQSIGESAEKAGNGFRLFAEGVKTLVDLSLGDLVATLTATATGVGAIVSHAGEMTTAGAGMQSMAMGLAMLGQAATSVQGAFTALPTLITSLTTSLNALPPILITTSTAVQMFSTNITTSLAGLMTASGSISAFNSQITSIGTAVGSVTSTIALFGTSLSMLGASFGMTSTSISALIGVVSGLTSALTQVGSTATTVSTQVTQIGTSIASVGASVSGMVASVSGAMSTLAGSISSAMSSALSSVQSTCQQFVSTLQQTASQMSQEGRRAGEEAGRNIAEGLRSNEGNIRSEMENIKNTVQSVGQSIVPVARDIGSQVSNGVAEGMYSALGAVTAAANAIINEVDRALRAKAQIHSPSRLTDKKTGRHLTGGVAQGMVKNMPVLDKAFSVYQRAIDKFKPNFVPENMLSFKGVPSFATAGGSSNNVTNNKTSNFGALLHIENLSTNSEEDVRKLYEQIKFLIKEEKDRL